MKNTLGLLVCLTLCSCGDNWQTNELPTGTNVSDVFAINVFAPYRVADIVDGMEIDKEPAASSSEGSASYHLNSKEYVCTHGRLRIHDEGTDGEYGWETSRWVELFPGKLYFDKIVKEPYRGYLDAKEGERKFTFTTADDKWFLTFELDGNAIKSIAYIPR